MIVPVLSIVLMDPHAFFIFAKISEQILFVLATGGFVFGVGMVLFTLCLNKLGMGIAFVLNISLGTIGGSLLPLFIFHPDSLRTPFGHANILAFIAFVVAVLLTSHAIHLRDQAKSKELDQTKNTWTGFALGVLSGLFCAMQGFVYAYSLPSFKEIASINGVSTYVGLTLPWLIIFASALIPYAIFQLYLQLKMKAVTNLFRATQLKNMAWIVLMGILYFSSILIYSKAVQNLGAFGQIIAWPLFMIFIILSANFWSLIQGEWRHSSLRSKFIFSLGILFIILAIVLLGYAACVRGKF